MAAAEVFAQVINFGVSPAKQAELEKRLAAVQVREEDLLEKFVRASGPGGQNVNKVATAVYLKHLPSGIEVKVQRARTQALNRFLARRLLADALEARQAGRAGAQSSKALTQVQKVRRQKNKRAKRARAKALRKTRASEAEP